MLGGRNGHDFIHKVVVKNRLFNGLLATENGSQNRCEAQLDVPTVVRKQLFGRG